MASPMFQRANYSDLFGPSALPALEELFRSELEMHPSRRDMCFKTVSTDRDIWQASELHDLPLFQVVPEGTEYSYSRQRQGASKTIVPVKYGMGFSISEEAVDDGKFDFISDGIKKLAKSARESQEVSAMNIFNNGFGTTDQTAADGLALFSSSHTMPSGRTIRNQLSTASDLSASSLEQALIDFEQVFVGDTGIINRIMPKVLLVNPANKRYAMELIGSELKADTADNNMNSLKQDGLIVVSSPHLTDTDAWFLLANPMETGLRIISRKAIETKAGGADVGFLSDSILYKARYREKISITHVNGVFGTAGA